MKSIAKTGGHQVAPNAISATEVNADRAATRANTPRGGPGVRIKQTTSGWSLAVAPATAPIVRRGNGCTALTLTKRRPLGYTADEDSTKGWVHWGVVNNVVIDNIAIPFALSTGLKVWVAVTTNGAVPLIPLTATIGTGATVPDDIGGTATKPPDTAHHLLGQVTGAGTTESPFTVFSTGCGVINLSAVAMGYSCVLADSGDPEADPVIPPTPGGVKTDYQLRWDRV